MGRGLPPYQVSILIHPAISHNRHGLKFGGVTFLPGSWVPTPHLAQCRLGRSLLTKWHLDPSSRLLTVDMDGKVGAAVPLFG